MGDKKGKKEKAKGDRQKQAKTRQICKAEEREAAAPDRVNVDPGIEIDREIMRGRACEIAISGIALAGGA